ncbi:MAG: DUF3368 domain-containing protein [Bacteroidetes bacterium B1(2017)]|nr:MAG: DUF3368 domain-containing protein [Bacteroidetes bacterium B1(2017)]
MPKVVISDTSCLIILSKIGELDLLQKIYGQVITTNDIADEFGETLPNWVEIKEVVDKVKQNILETQLDKGESSAIALALEMPDSILIIDDYKARVIAHKLGLSLTGTLGVIVKAKKAGIIDSIKPFLRKIKQTNFRISITLEMEALKAADEQTMLE